MTVVAIYGFTGKYSGNSEYTWNSPEPGATHKCMLFLRQESDFNEYELALAECRKYGFEEIENVRYGKLRIEVLNTNLYRGFAGFYRERFRRAARLSSIQTKTQVAPRPNNSFKPKPLRGSA